MRKRIDFFLLMLIGFGIVWAGIAHAQRAGARARQRDNLGNHQAKTNLNMMTFGVTNMADPVNNQDAVTLGFLTNFMGTQTVIVAGGIPVDARDATNDILPDLDTTRDLGGPLKVWAELHVEEIHGPDGDLTLFVPPDNNFVIIGDAGNEGFEVEVSDHMDFIQTGSGGIEIRTTDGDLLLRNTSVGPGDDLIVQSSRILDLIAGLYIDFNRDLATNVKDIVSFPDDILRIESVSTNILLKSESFISVQADLLPQASNLFDLGSLELPWANLFLPTNSFFMGTNHFTATDTRPRWNGVGIALLPDLADSVPDVTVVREQTADTGNTGNQDLISTNITWSATNSPVLIIWSVNIGFPSDSDQEAQFTLDVDGTPTSSMDDVQPSNAGNVATAMGQWVLESPTGVVVVVVSVDPLDDGKVYDFDDVVIRLEEIE